MTAAAQLVQQLALEYNFRNGAWNTSVETRGLFQLRRNAMHAPNADSDGA